MKTSTITDGIETTLRSLAPIDLADAPLYVVLQSENPPADRLLLDSWGNYHPKNDLVFRLWLESCGRWRGRGPLVVVNDLDIRDASPAEDSESNILGIAIHELAHALSTGFDLIERTAAETAMIELRASFAISRLNAAPPSTLSQNGLPWAGHDAHFIRVAAHLSHRAKLAGIAVELERIVDLEQYELRSNCCEYFSSVEGEFEQFTGLPLTTLRQYRPPRDFERVWRRDLSEWCQQEPDDAKAESAFADMDDRFFSGVEKCLI